MDEASPLHALCCLMSESKHAGPDWSAASSLFHHGRVESADPEEKREPCERHPNTPIDGRKSEVLDIERPNREGMQTVLCPRLVRTLDQHIDLGIATPKNLGR